MVFRNTYTSGADVEGEQQVPQRDPSVVEFDEDDVSLRKKRKAKAYSTSDIGPSKKKHKQFIVFEMVNIWGVSIEEAREFARQHNIQTTNRLITRKDKKRIQQILSDFGSISDQIESLNKFQQFDDKGERS